MPSLYGELEQHEGVTSQPFAYNGRDGVMTDANGLYYMRARYYDPKLKRFLNRDVIRGDIQDGQTFNRYAYVNGNPVSYIDPLGLMKCETEGAGNGADNIAQFAKYKELLKVEEAANPVVDSLRQTGQLPSNYVTKSVAEQSRYKPGKALNNYVQGGQIGGDVFENTTKILPEAHSRVWYEADIGLSNTMSRSKQPGTRLLYSNDGQMYIATDHYVSVNFIGTYK